MVVVRDVEDWSNRRKNSLCVRRIDEIGAE